MKSRARYGRTGRALEPNLHLVLQALVVSAVIVAAAGPFAYGYVWPLHKQMTAHTAEVAAWLLVIVVVIPYGLGRGFRVVANWADAYPNHWAIQGLRAVVPQGAPPSLWDWAEVAGVMDGRHVVIEYRDGRQLAGAHGHPGVSVTSPEPHGIYLSAEWEVSSGRVLRPLPGTAGVLVPITEDVRCIHIFNSVTGGNGRMDIERRVPAIEHEVRGIRPHREQPPQNPPPSPQPKPDRDGQESSAR